MGRSVSRRTIENAPRNLVELEVLMDELDRLRAFAEWVAGYDSERQLVGSGETAFFFKQVGGRTPKAGGRERHADEPIVCPKCGSSSPCMDYGPGCP